ncbi:iron complex transport system substrate-binding protein [Streptomyces zhaozhouensis]|uniref:Iron complex transport system substrate-binding protein n=1 Tax=Streptomyces zhaozhouensis TaxID=1300267 RepID=A0A286DXG4_9ACTN|nr:ABC transporter substrate-binding protein [Streptomyces zhaozhouensis]SOD63367.1 iron complex transport system substrate-binding protein [Streptomyces zhaozhouensis]
MTKEHTPGTENAGGRHEGWEFEDDRGVRVTRDRPPRRIVAYTQIAAALWDEGVRPLGHFGSLHDGQAPDPAKSGLLPLDEIPYHGPGGALRVERLVATSPELLVGVTYDGKRLYGVEEPVAEELEARVPLVALDVGPGRGLDEVSARLAALAGTLGARAAVPADELARRLDAARQRLRAAAAGAPGARVLALSPAGPDAAYLARATAWPDLRALAEQGVLLATPPDGPGANWATGDWSDAVALDPAIVLGDVRGNAARPAEFRDNAGWLRLSRGARVLPWNPELPPSALAQARFLDTVSEALESLTR